MAGPSLHIVTTALGAALIQVNPAWVVPGRIDAGFQQGGPVHDLAAPTRRVHRACGSRRLFRAAEI